MEDKILGVEIVCLKCNNTDLLMRKDKYDSKNEMWYKCPKCNREIFVKVK